MIRLPLTVALGCALLAACNEQPANQNSSKIRVVSPEQQQLHQLDAYNLGIALKRAIYDAGYTCKTVTDAGYVGTWENLDEWVASCKYDKGPPEDWAIFAGPNGSAQVRICRDVEKSGLPACKITKRPSGNFLLNGKTEKPKAAEKKSGA